jgi:hypothetical protein
VDLASSGCCARYSLAAWIAVRIASAAIPSHSSDVDAHSTRASSCAWAAARPRFNPELFNLRHCAGPRCLAPLIARPSTSRRVGRGLMQHGLIARRPAPQRTYRRHATGPRGDGAHGGRAAAPCTRFIWECNPLDPGRTACSRQPFWASARPSLAASDLCSPSSGNGTAYRLSSNSSIFRACGPSHRRSATSRGGTETNRAGAGSPRVELDVEIVGTRGDMPQGTQRAATDVSRGPVS